jgi:hypothetical protein
LPALLRSFRCRNPSLNLNRFEANLTNRDFPESYRGRPARLHAKFPDWRFVVRHAADFFEAVEIMHTPAIP